MRSLVLVPSQLCTAAVWEHQIAALRGLADITIAANSGFDSMRRLAAAILESSPGRFALAAHGMGGFIAFEMWRQAAHRIERLALLGTLAPPDTETQVRRRRGYSKLVQSGRFARVIEERVPILFKDGPDAHETLIGIARSMATETGPERFLRQQEAILSRPDSRRTLATIDCPTLIVAGRDDRVAPVNEAMAMAQAIPSCRLEVIPDCGHLLMLEQPERTTHLLKEWFAA
jgi:pimeloyl-ACP methyl ester carboxylesterase